MRDASCLGPRKDAGAALVVPQASILWSEFILYHQDFIVPVIPLSG